MQLLFKLISCHFYELFENIQGGCWYLCQVEYRQTRPNLPGSDSARCMDVYCLYQKYQQKCFEVVTWFSYIFVSNKKKWLNFSSVFHQHFYRNSNKICLATRLGNEHLILLHMSWLFLITVVAMFTWRRKFLSAVQDVKWIRFFYIT